MREELPRVAPGRVVLRGDCVRCAGLCCVAPGFTASAEFALDKPPGRPCPHLGADFGCGIHAQLGPRGFSGCAAYDCFGAGQQVIQVTYAGRTWRDEPGLAAQMFSVFAVMRQLHELRWHLGEALQLPAAQPLRSALTRALEEVEGLAGAPPHVLAGLDVAARRRAVVPLLRRTSEHVRAHAAARLERTPPDHRGADLAGADLRGRDLRGVDLSGALLLGADLRAADLRDGDLLGADLRGADLRGTDLSSAFFLTGPQVASARRDAATRLPPRVS